jgi:hypothetical protein
MHKHLDEIFNMKPKDVAKATRMAMKRKGISPSRYTVSASLKWAKNM